MIKVNLLTERKQKKQKKAELPFAGEKKALPFLTILAIVTGATVLIMGIIFFILKTNVSNLKDEYQKNQAQMVDLKKKIEESKRLEALNKAIQQKSDLIKMLKKNQSVPARLLDDISKLLPDGIWLTSVSFTNPQAVIEGIGFSNIDVVSLVDNLKKSPDYTDVYLDESKQGNIEKVEVYNFKLHFKVKA